MKQVNLMLEDNAIEVYINGDPSRNIVFNPTAMGFVEKYIDLVNFAKTAQNDPKYKAEVKQSEDLEEIVDSMQLGISAYKLFFNDVSEKVDALFGEGTTFKATQGECDIAIVINLLQGLAKHINKAQDERLKTYLGANRKARRSK